MCGIAGFCNLKNNFLKNNNKYTEVIENMGNSIKHRGPDDSNNYINEKVVFTHRRLSIIDLTDGQQPMTSNCGNYTIIYNGEIYNSEQIKEDLIGKNYQFKTSSDTEVILASYIHYGIESPKLLNGIFSYVIWDNINNTLFMCRDRAGVKPLFYTIQKDTIIFGSEIKALLKYPEVKPIVNKDGLCEILGLFPSRSEGNGIFKNINEIGLGCYATFNDEGFNQYKYWELISKQVNMSYNEAVEQTKFLVTDAIKKQMISDVPISTLLSGGIDSSIITGVIANEFAKKGKRLDTYSFDFENSSKYFISSSFQNDTDTKWILEMVKKFDTNHTFLECSTKSLVDSLYKAVDAKDYTGMADIDASLLYFCGEIKNKHKVTLSGECADEIFGGYPWFHDEDSFKNDAFPWIRNLDFRLDLLLPELKNSLGIKEYVENQYYKTIKEVPKLSTENEIESRRREIAYLNIKWFMPTLLDRSDRMSMYNGLEVRVPYADHRIIELLWNLPWEFKYKGSPKSLLKDAFKDLLPIELINRKKNPYPKTYNPLYSNMLKKELSIVIEDESSPILKILDKQKINDLIECPNNNNLPWFGQLMAETQLIAYYLQLNYWLKKYEVILEL